MHRRLIALTLVLMLSTWQGASAQDPAYWSTFSIIAVDPASGMAGVAIASSTWTEHASDILTPGISPGTGIIISQAALLERNYARGVQLLKEGKTAKDVIDTLKREDTAFETRQIAVVDSAGRSEAFSGSQTMRVVGKSGRPVLQRAGQHPGEWRDGAGDGGGVHRVGGQAAGRIG